MNRSIKAVKRETAGTALQYLGLWKQSDRTA